MTSFAKPKNLEFPKVYCTLERKCHKSGENVEYKIQDLPENRYEEAAELLVEYYLQDEPVAMSRKMYENENSRKEMRMSWMNAIEQGLSVACIKNDVELVGVNVLTITCKDSEASFKASDKNVQDICTFMDYTLNQANIFSKYNVDKYLGSLGLCVNRAYRGCGIAKELLRTRIQIMKDLGLTVTATVFTAKGSQNAAKSVGFEDIFVISFEDLSKISPDLNFVNEYSNFCKIMALKI